MVPWEGKNMRKTRQLPFDAVRAGKGKPSTKATPDSKGRQRGVGEQSWVLRQMGSCADQQPGDSKGVNTRSGCGGGRGVVVVLRLIFVVRGIWSPGEAPPYKETKSLGKGLWM
ncbi:hypothetical protein CLAIMM_12108 isoform 2 [Cladophialophora immunda]|nr:hypothetical protein CLAIMM_12108 isoform 2 [Cladophialophora immunda]